MSVINIALLGCGTVGSRVAELITKRRADIRRRTGFDLNLRKILVRDATRPRHGGLEGSLFTSRFADVLADDKFDLGIEVLGGTDPALPLVQGLLARGVSVVTANKSLLAHHGETLRRTAARSGVALAHEATVCAAIPLLNTLRNLAGEPVHSIRGIVSGSCNFILTHMAAEGVELGDALAEARTRGLVEPDPSSDLSGRDAAEKVCVLAASLGRSLLPRDVATHGIDAITLDDLRQARDFGYAVRSIATLDESGGRVGPLLIPLRHWLAGVHGECNAVAIHGEWSGETILQGNGAGPGPTASAIIGDVISVLRGGWRIQASEKTRGQLSIHDRESKEGHFVRFKAPPAQASPSHVLPVLRANGIGARRIEFRNGTVTFITEPTKRSSIAAALEQISVEEETVFIAQCWRELDSIEEAVVPDRGQEALVSAAA